MTETITNPNPYFPRTVTVKVTPDHVKDYFLDTPAAMSSLLDQLIKTQPYMLDVFLDEHQQDFEEFVLSRVGGAY